ncbi:unnamed protein product [Echinostoma caproni]|uniref:Uncharacterized protein n=1 Tax=Echinostoma caproni TaxID=27848 RepID=A0A183B3W7_9TREM|nr:unnamed protein product [Echinostoma caproni]
MRPRPDSGRTRIALPPLEGGISNTPACGQLITPVPVGLSAEANAVVGSETITIRALDLQKIDSLDLIHTSASRYATPEVGKAFDYFQGVVTQRKFRNAFPPILQQCLCTLEVQRT